jgi:type II secretory pathway component PulM
MKAQAIKLWESRKPRERVIFVVAAVIICAALYLWLIQAAGQARARLSAGIPLLKAQAAQFEQHIAEYERLKKAPASATSQTDLRGLVLAQVEAAGLSRALIRVDAPDANRVEVVFSDVPFATWLAWVVSLQSQQVRLDTSRIEASAKPGLVIVTATFIRPQAH